MRRIYVKRRLRALVDDADYDRLKEYSWHCHRGNTGIKYAVAYKGKRPGRSDKYISMHRLVLGYRGKKSVDHINGNGLDNRRGNLRIVTASQNNANSIFKRKPMSGYRGVAKNAKDTWLATVRVNKRPIYITGIESFGLAKAVHRAMHTHFFGEHSFYSRNEI